MSDGIVIKAAFACDDVRHERSGKYIFIGSYNDTIFVSSFPVSLRLHFVVVSAVTSAGEHKVQLRVGDEDTPEGSALEVSATAPTPTSNELFSFGPMTIAANKPQQFWLERQTAGKWERIATWTLAPIPRPAPPTPQA